MGFCPFYDLGKVVQPDVGIVKNSDVPLGSDISNNLGHRWQINRLLYKHETITKGFVNGFGSFYKQRKINVLLRLGRLDWYV